MYAEHAEHSPLILRPQMEKAIPSQHANFGPWTIIRRRLTKLAATGIPAEVKRKLEAIVVASWVR